MLMTTGMYRQT